LEQAKKTFIDFLLLGAREFFELFQNSFGCGAHGGKLSQRATLVNCFEAGQSLLSE
jgi:hypothetical protein